MNNTLNKPIRTLVFTLLLLLSACATLPTPQQRNEKAVQLALSHGWQQAVIPTSHFDLVSFHSTPQQTGKLLTVYIEGDGLAWLNKKTISTDPTPVNPLGLKLALQHPQANAAYLARPCQFTGGVSARGCSKQDWTDGRFSEQVIASTNEALSSLKAEFSAEQLHLIGFSGGGAVAALLAARRSDVTHLITVAGNVNHTTWTAHHHISPLSGSLNPADYQPQLAHIKQVHLVGSDDNVIPPFLAQQFVDNLGNPIQADVIVVPAQDHNCCWDAIWADLLKQFQFL